MKSSAATHKNRPDDEDDSACQRFAKAMRALIAVPKDEVAGKLTELKRKKTASLSQK